MSYFSIQVKTSFGITVIRGNVTYIKVLLRNTAVIISILDYPKSHVLVLKSTNEIKVAVARLDPEFLNGGWMGKGLGAWRIS